MLIVTLPALASRNPSAFALKAKKEGADVLEIRSDLTPSLKKFRSVLPVLYSIRTEEFALPEGLKPTYLDFDVDQIHLLEQENCKGMKIILSHHDFTSTLNLQSLQKIVQKMYSYKSWMIKIVTYVRDYKDILVLQKLQEFMNKKSIRSTVLGMGEKAHLTRALSPLKNIFTYTYLDGDLPVAEGQLPLSFYRMTAHAKKPRVFGIIGGSQVAHSLSPLLQNALFRRHKIDAVYSCFPTDNFLSTVNSLRLLGLHGCSVTAPFKKQALDIASKADALSQKLGSANTLLFSLTPSPSPERRGETVPFGVRQCFLPPSGEGLSLPAGQAGMGEVTAFNTDYFGIQKGYPFLARSKSIAILGAGGVVPSVIEGIRKLNPESTITVFARHVQKAHAALKEDFVEIQSLSMLDSAYPDALVCALSEDIDLTLPKAKKGAIAIDLRYGKETKFMKNAQKKGYKVYDGIPMLIQQALRQFEYFTGTILHQEDENFISALVRSQF